MAVLAKCAGKESVLLLSHVKLHIHTHLKCLFVWQKDWCLHPVAMWCLQAVVTSACEPFYSFIVQNDPSSAVVVGRFSQCNTHANSICFSIIQSPWKTTGVLQLSYVLQYRSFCPDRQISCWLPGACITCILVWILFKQKDMTNCLVTLINGCPWGRVRHEMKLNNSNVHYSTLPHHLKCLIVPKKWIPF